MNIEEAVVFSCLSPIVLTGAVLSAEREFAGAISDVKVECSMETTSQDTHLNERRAR